MALVSAAIPNLMNGVSQQPYVQRLVSQGEIQLNGHSSLVEGLRKRPPSVHIAKLRNTPLTNAFLHTINRSTIEQYEVILDGTSLQVFDMLGNPRTVNFPNGTGYLTSADPKNDYAITTVADYTFIANKTVTVATLPTTTPTRPFEAIVWCRAGDYSTTYTLNVGGRSVSYTTLDSSVANDAISIQTTFMAEQLYLGLTGGASQPGASLSVSGTLQAGVYVQNLGSSLYIYSNAGDFSVSASDGQGDTNIVVSKGQVQNFANLPASCINGVVFQIAGEGDDGTDPSYYVQYQTDNNNQYGGVWVECAKPGEAYQLDPSTMPCQLVREADGTFTFQQATWNDRQVGDIANCPFPSFVGQTINDVFFYQNRLGFCANENVIMSQTAYPFNFTRISAMQLLATDPIDLGSTSTQASVLKYAIPFQNTILLFADLMQFQLTYQAGNAVLSPQTTSITPATNYTCSLAAKPAGGGSSVFFAFPRGAAWTGIREYYLDGAGRINETNDVTSQVPQYIPGTAYRLSAATNEDCLVVMSDGDPTSLWVYRYLWQGGQKLQSAWSQWQFQPTDTILNAEFIQDYLYVVISRADGVYLEMINIQPGLTETGQNFLVHLDRKVQNAPYTYNATTKLSTITLPYEPPDWTQVVCVGWGGGVWDIGVVLPVTSTGANTFTVPGDVGGQFMVGITYTFRYRFSTFITREPVPMTYSMQAVTDGRLQIRNVLVNYSNSGYFRAEVTPFGRPMGSYVWTAGALGQANSAAGSVWINTGTVKFPVQCRNTYAQVDLVNDTFLPCFFESAGWEGFFILRSQRVS